ncbi:hypothetical protein HOY80DRAFT_1134607 [Tuber brumale]|nr:hypothetical protein HOY80DRAFT_1134607 [Tuber brumale]
MSPLSTPVTAEMIVAPGICDFAGKRRADSASESDEPIKRSRLAEGPAVVDTVNERDGDGQIGLPLNPRGSNSPIHNGVPTILKGEGGGTSWRCTKPGCLTVIPNVDTEAGIRNRREHLYQHYLINHRGRSQVISLALQWYNELCDDLDKEDQVILEELNRIMKDDSQPESVLGAQSTAGREHEAQSNVFTRELNNGTGNREGEGKQ